MDRHALGDGRISSGPAVCGGGGSGGVVVVAIVGQSPLPSWQSGCNRQCGLACALLRRASINNVRARNAA